MKTVSGEIVSSKPIPLSAAAEYISKFAASDNGASPAFAAYLRHTSAAFNELAHLHEKLQISHGEHSSKQHLSGDVDIGKDVHGPNSQNDGNADEQKKHKSKKVKNEVKEEKDYSSIGSAEQNGKALVSDVQPLHGGNALTLHNDGDEQKKQKKHKLKNEVKEERENSIRSTEHRDDRLVDNVEKKDKRKRTHEAEERDNGARMETETANKKESRKRKHERVSDGGLDCSQEVHRSKKKKT